MAEWWLNEAYLKGRSPLPVYSSASFVFPREKFNTEHEKIQFAAALIAGFLDYKRILES